MGSIIGLAFFAAVNPTLLAVVTIMMLLPNTKKLMLGYLLGAYITSIAVGMAIVFTLHDSSAVDSAKRTLSPIEDLVIGAVLLLIGYVLHSGRGAQMRERRKHHKEEKSGGEPKQSWPERMLGRGSARVTFVVGLLLSFPGVSYLAALTRIAKLDWTALPTATFVIVVALIQQMLLELPLLGYAFAPDWTEGAITRFRTWISRSGLRAASYVAFILGGLLILRGVITLL